MRKRPSCQKKDFNRDHQSGYSHRRFGSLGRRHEREEQISTDDLTDLRMKFHGFGVLGE
jgi:hypothetical protein